MSIDTIEAYFIFLPFPWISSLFPSIIAWNEKNYFLPQEKYELIYKVEGLDNNKVIVDVENPNVAKVKVNNNKIVIEGLNKGETVLKIRAKDEESIERWLIPW